jgi:hypothetical protein
LWSASAKCQQCCITHAAQSKLDPVLLHIAADDKLLERISKQLNQIAAD